MTDTYAASIAMQSRATNKSIELLLGIVTGLIADEQLHDMEIQFLATWLIDHPEASSVWPGCVIVAKIRETLADGIITQVERSHLLKVLQDMAVSDFAVSGSTAANVLQLPIDDSVDVDLRDQMVCHSGEFIFGTRAKCEQLTIAVGGHPVGNISRKVAYLVIGTNVSPAWAHTSYGRKIEAAIELQSNGHGIRIISENRWLQAIGK